VLAAKGVIIRTCRISGNSISALGQALDHLLHTADTALARPGGHTYCEGGCAEDKAENTSRAALAVLSGVSGASLGVHPPRLICYAEQTMRTRRGSQRRPVSQ